MGIDGARQATGSRVTRYPLVVLALLCLVYVLNFLDRQLLSILAKPIQDDLGLTDGQLGRLRCRAKLLATRYCPDECRDR